MDADQIRVVHVWAPGGRSLCDRVPLTRAQTGDESRVSSPACGACMLLVSYIRRQAAAVLKLTPGVWPELPSQAWEELRGTRWEQVLDLDSLASVTDLDERSRFDALTLMVDPATVDLVIDGWREGR